MKDRILRFNLYLGLGILSCSAVLLGFEVFFIKTWFFSLAWWSFILIMDSLNYRKSGTSPLSGPFDEFLFMAFISVFVWLVFELFNLRLNNWSYHGLPENMLVRWLGYFIAFATVMPAMREISLFVESLLKNKKLALFRLRPTPFLLKGFLVFGTVCIFLIIIWPRAFFPLTWLCFIFLLEPLNIWLGNESYVKDMDKKDWTRFWSWILAGLVAGILWEFWNFWAGSHWVYHLPYLDFWRFFQMPVFGYTGFLPFALEIFAFYCISLFLYRKLKGKVLLKSVIFIVLLFSYAAVFFLIDKFSLK
jgi:hypothetical protein